MTDSTPRIASGAAIERALQLLNNAAAYARGLNLDAWQFALEINELRRVGLTNNEFRWLLAQGMVSQGVELTTAVDSNRRFLQTSTLTLCAETCFILTELGQQTASEIDSERATVPAANGNHRDVAGCRINSDLCSTEGGSEAACDEAARPLWDGIRKELRFAGSLVKVFRWPACNQEVVLSVFQEEGWPHRIDDPLTPQPQVDTKRRLHDTIKCLNRRQVAPVLRFRGDGTGEGVLWEPVILTDC